MGVYIEGLDRPRGEYMRIHIDFDGEVWVFRGSEWKSLGIKATNLDIVRCGDCDKGEETISGKIRCKLDSLGLVWEKTDFCSYGKRRTDETIESITFKKMVKAVKEEMRDVQNFAERRNDGTVCSYGVPANADQHTQRVESVGERRTDE